MTKDSEIYEVALFIPKEKSLEEVFQILEKLRDEPTDLYLHEFNLTDQGLFFTGQYGSSKQRWIVHNIKKISGVELDWDTMSEWIE